jgi:hypothetical protein
MYQQAGASKRRRKEVSVTQGGPAGGGFKKGYMSFVTDSRMPFDALADLTNMTLDQDNLPRPRPSLVEFGEQPLGTMLGVGTFIKIVAGVPQKWDISMQVIAGVGKIHVRKDGETWVAATGAGNSYDDEAVVNFCQSANRVYVSNGVNAMSYYDVDSGAIVVYTSLTTPSAPTVTRTGLTGTTYTYYYKVTANNAVGESASSLADSEQASKLRDNWASATEYMDISWSAVSGALSYNVYVGTTAGDEKYLITLPANALSYRDDATVAPNTFKSAPAFNSTEGPVLTTMWNTDGRLWGVGDVDHPEYLWYDGGDGAEGIFSVSDGGGNVSINPGGDTVPVAVRSFRTGKGDSAVTVLSRGVAGTGKMHHISFSSFTFESDTYYVPSPTEANGQSGTVSARAVVEANNSLWYPTGQDFRSTGTSANIQNILSTNSVSNDIIPDVQNLNLSAMDGACGLLYENKIYWALPVGASENNQIWVKDLSRGGVWIMPWLISAKFMWLSEDNTTGEISHCIYDGTSILKFTRSVATQDNGVSFRTRVAHEGLVWAENGLTMAAIQEQRFKLLQPVGEIQINSFGLNEDGLVDTLGSETFSQSASSTGWGQLLYSDEENPSLYSDDIGMVDFYSASVGVVTLEIDETVNQLGWEVVTDSVNCDYYLSTVHTNGIEIPRSYLGD